MVAKADSDQPGIVPGNPEASLLWARISDEDPDLRPNGAFSMRGHSVGGFGSVTTNKVIAIDLGISQRTVEIHRSRVMEKMETHSLAHLVRMVLATKTP